MRDDQFVELLALGHEQQGVEFKGPGPRTDKYLQGKVLRAILGMANRRDGGHIIIGVEEKGKSLTPKGLTEDDAKTWNHDDLAATLANYADPAVTFTVALHRHEGRPYILITVSEFDDIPILCKKDYPDPTNLKELLLRCGACYVRSRHKPETSEIPTHAEMRDLLDSAAQKRLRWFLTQASGAGLPLPGPQPPDDEARFAAQYASVSDPVIDTIRSRGHTQIVIRPAPFVPERLSPLTSLLPHIQRARVSRLGWDFPQTWPETEVAFSEDGISKASEWNNHMEWWALYNSAQFVMLRAFEVDWLEKATHLGPWREGLAAIQPQTVLNIYDVVRLFVEVFEFTARLALEEVFTGNEPIHVTITLRGLKGRQLVLLGAPQRAPLMRRVTQAGDYSNTHVVTGEEVSANSSAIALQEVRKLFERFNWEPAAGLLEALLAEITPT